MPSAEGGRTLTRRLAWALVLASTLGAAIALAAALLAADALIRAQVERSAGDAAHVMAVELGEDLAMVPAVEAEMLELHIDARVAVMRGDEVIAGDPSLRGGSRGVCEPRAAAGSDELVCTQPVVGHEELVVVVAMSAEPSHRRPMLLAGLAGLAIVVIGAAFTGSLLARRFLSPLERLRQAVADADATAPAGVQLPGRTGLDEIDALRAALASLLARLDVELARARHFAAHAAHELRTPLTRMLTELELAVEIASTSEHAATLTKVQRSTEQLIVLTERLLLLAAPHDALVVAQATSMSQLVEDLRRQRPAAEAERLVLATEASDGLVCGDAVLLGVMLDNIVDNALKFSSGPVHVRVREEDDEVIVEVRDHGPGLPADSDALLEPFRRGAAVAQVPGHGLGLPLVAHIARACGGRVRLGDVGVVGETGAHVEVRMPAV